MSYDGNVHTLPSTGGGGGGAATPLPTFARAVITSGDIAQPSTTASWTPVSGLSLVLPATVGDNVSLVVGALFDTLNGTNYYEAVAVNGSTITRFGSTGTSSPNGGGEGDPSTYPTTANQRFQAAVIHLSFTAAAGDINAGNVTFGIAHKGSGGAKILAGNYPFRWAARNDHH
jgi:hypothetical protein